MDGIKPSDGSQSNPPRTLKESAQFQKEKESLLKDEDYRRLDEIIQGLDLDLCRFPARYPIVVPGTELRIFVTRRFLTVPSFKIWYMFSDTVVELLHIEVAEDEIPF